MKSNLPKVSLLQVVKWNLDNPSTQAYLAECYVNKITFSYLIKICEKKNPCCDTYFCSRIMKYFPGCLLAVWLACNIHEEKEWRNLEAYYSTVCPYKHCCPPRWRQRAAGGCCAAAAWRRACGGVERARLAGSAPSAPLPSPWTPWDPAGLKRRLCTETSTMRNKPSRSGQGGKSCLTSRRLRRWERDWRRGSRRPQACR